MTDKVSNRTDIINYLIKYYNYSSYLEIGVGNKNRNFNKIRCKNKKGIDPNGKADIKLTSDIFFADCSIEEKYDIIFIDGLHIEEQVDKDISNSFLHLNDKGMIVLHDCNPVSELLQEEKRKSKDWCGTVWKSFAKLRMTRKDLFMFVVNIDYGVGVIKKGEQQIFVSDKGFLLDYKFLDSNRSKLLNIISPEKIFNIL